MKQSTVVWTGVLALGAIFLIYRASTGRMGRIYVVQQQVTATVDDTPYSWTRYVGIKPGEKLRLPDGSPNPAVQFSLPRTIGLWCAAFGTLCIFSFLWRDNVFYKLAEAVMVGVSAAYAMVVGFWTAIVQNLFGKLVPDLMRQTVVPGLSDDQQTEYSYLVPLLLSVMMLWRLSPVGGWISRWPLAFFIGATAGIRLLAYLDADFVKQIQSTILPLLVAGANGEIDFAASLKNLTIVVGVLACLVYFFFSVEHTGTVGRISRLGIWFLMITFGAGFGYTVMGRIALLSARLEVLFDDWLWLIDPVGKRLGW